jgi:hypothetical protein
MDYRNNSIPVDKLTSFDVNKAIQRSLTKAVARHGLGLYIYAGEDLPEDDTKAAPTETPKSTTTAKSKAKAPEAKTAAKDPLAEVKAAYQELITYCKENDHDIKEVAKAYSLNAKSTAEEFKTALKRLILADTEKKLSEYPEEV